MKKVKKMIIQAKNRVLEEAINKYEQVYMGFVDMDKGIYTIRLNLMKEGNHTNTICKEVSNKQDAQRFIDDTILKYPMSEDFPVIWSDYGDTEEGD